MDSRRIELRFVGKIAAGLAVEGFEWIPIPRCDRMAASRCLGPPSNPQGDVLCYGSGRRERSEIKCLAHEPFLVRILESDGCNEGREWVRASSLSPVISLVYYALVATLNDKQLAYMS